MCALDSYQELVPLLLPPHPMIQYDDDDDDDDGDVDDDDDVSDDDVDDDDDYEVGTQIECFPAFARHYKWRRGGGRN